MSNDSFKIFIVAVFSILIILVVDQILINYLQSNSSGSPAYDILSSQFVNISANILSDIPVVIATIGAIAIVAIFVKLTKESVVENYDGWGSYIPYIAATILVFLGTFLLLNILIYEFIQYISEYF